MHLENGKIVPDTAEEHLIFGEAEIVGSEPWSPSDYPGAFYVPRNHTNTLIARLEASPRNDRKAVIIGLTRIAMSQKKNRILAIDMLSQLAEKAIDTQE